MTMPDSGAAVTREAALCDDEVAAFLRANPDFFLRHAALLAEIEVPHDGGGAVSLVERKLKLLNDDIGRLKARHRHMVQVAEANAALHARVYTLALDLVEAADADRLFTVLARGLEGDFSADAATVWLAPLGDAVLAPTAGTLPVVLTDADDGRVAMLEEWLGSGAQCGRLTEQELTALFPGVGIASAVVLPFETERCRGVIAIGSTDAARFATQLATDALEFLAATAAARMDAQLRSSQDRA